MSNVDQVELRIVEVPLRTPFASAAHVTTHKTAVLVTVRGAGIEGYGEGVMEPLPWFREETIGGAMVVLTQALIPDLLAAGCNEPAELAGRWSMVRGNPMAKAALEMAVWDLRARQQDLALWQMLGGDGLAVEVGAALGLLDDLGQLIETVDRHVAEGYRRVKLKVAAGREREIVETVRQRHPHIALSVDANAAYSLNDTPTLAHLDPFDLDYIEQPLHWDDLVDHALLASQIATPICLDESLSSLRRVEEALDLRACAVVNVKAGRLGGHQAVRRTAQLCRANGVPMWCGGMLELGVGRAHNIHLATLPGFDLPGDTASATRTFATDIVEQPLEATDGLMPVPPGPGIGVTLDRAYVEKVTVERVTLAR